MNHASNHLIENLFPESVFLAEYRKIIKICRRVNASTRGEMDLRPILDHDLIRELQEDYTALFTFFAQLEFLACRKEHPDDSQWSLNSKLDDEWAANIFSNGIDLLATGIYKLDDILKGGFRVYRDIGGIKEFESKCAESLVVTLQGKPGAGKTTLALELLCNFAAQGYSSVYAASEQSTESLLRTIERFCDEFQRVEKNDATGRPIDGLYTGTFEQAPSSDRSRFLTEFAKFVVQVCEAECQGGSLTVDHEFAKYFPKARLLLLQRKWNPDMKKNDADVEVVVRPSSLFEWAQRIQVHFNKRLDFFVVLNRSLPGGEGEQSNESQIAVAQEVQRLVTLGKNGIVLAKIRKPVTEEESQPPLRTDSSRSQGFVDLSAESLGAFLQSLRTTFTDGVLPDFVPSWVAIDTISAFDRLGSRESILEAKEYFEREGLPTSIMLLTEIIEAEGGQPTAQEILSDKVIELGERSLQIADVRDSGSNYLQRYLEVKKCRLGPFHRGKHPIAIKSTTVKAYRSIAILLKASGKRRRGEYRNEIGTAGAVDPGTLTFGIDGMDGPLSCLNDSMRKGSVTVIHGPPGAHKTAICGYFLNSADQFEQRQSSRSVIYSFGGDRRGVLSGMQQYIRRDGTRVLRDNHEESLVIRDIAPGYLFPENFVEDLIETLNPKSWRNLKKPISRVVFDSFDSVHAAFPIMRMDQFLWKVIFQVCWDYRVSAIVKISDLPGASPYYQNMAAQVTSMADNIIEIDRGYEMRIVESETGAHPRGKLLLEAVHWDCNFTRYRTQEEAGLFPVPKDRERGIQLNVRLKDSGGVSGYGGLGSLREAP